MDVLAVVASIGGAVVTTAENGWYLVHHILVSATSLYIANDAIYGRH